MQTKTAVNILSMILGFVLIFTAGYYREAAMPFEMASFQLKLNQTPGEIAKSPPLLISTANTGLLKKTLRPWTIHIRAGSISNEGKEPVHLRFSLEDSELPVSWESRQLAWDEKTKTINRFIMPGQSLKYGLSLFFHVPPEYRNKPVIYDGDLKVSDVKTGRVLAIVPIKLTNTPLTHEQIAAKRMPASMASSRGGSSGRSGSGHGGMGSGKTQSGAPSVSSGNNTGDAGKSQPVGHGSMGISDSAISTDNANGMSTGNTGAMSDTHGAMPGNKSGMSGGMPADHGKGVNNR